MINHLVFSRHSSMSSRPVSSKPKKHPPGSLLRQYGNQIQAKLHISQKNDYYEHQADQMADRVIQNKPFSYANTTQQGGDGIQRKARSSSSTSANKTGNLSAELGQGQVLSADVRRLFEPRFGADFSEVRIYRDERAAVSAQSLNARAYTFGSNIVFDQDEYTPQSIRGQKLLAHELAHVVQQRQQSNLSGAVQRQEREQETEPTPQGGDDWVRVVVQAVRDVYGLARIRTRLTPGRTRFLENAAFEQAFRATSSGSLEERVFEIFLDAESNNVPYQILQHNRMLPNLEYDAGWLRIRRFVQQGIQDGFFIGRSREYLIQRPPGGGELRGVRQQPYQITPEELVAASVGGFTTSESRRSRRRVTIRTRGGSFGSATLFHETVHFYSHPRFDALADNRQDGALEIPTLVNITQP